MPGDIGNQKTGLLLIGDEGIVPPTPVLAGGSWSRWQVSPRASASLGAALLRLSEGVDWFGLNVSLCRRSTVCAPWGSQARSLPSNPDRL
jgi:hypothetical protein